MSAGALWSTRAAVSRWMSACARERLLEVLVPRHVGEDPELDLASSRRRPAPCPAIAGDERAPDPPPELRADGDVLEVRVRRRKPAGRGDRLVERRVQPAVGRDQRRQRLDVGRAQLRVDPPVEDRLDHRVDADELLEHRGVGRVAGLRPPALGQPQLLEQDVAELLGRADRELVPDGGVDLAPRGARSRPRTRARAPPARRGRRRRRRLHAREHRDERQLDLAEQPLEALLLEGAREGSPDRERRERLEAGAMDRLSSFGGGKTRSSRSATTSAIDWRAERRVEDVRRDLRVEVDLVAGAPARRRSAHEDRLRLVGDEREAAPRPAPERVRGRAPRPRRRDRRARERRPARCDVSARVAGASRRRPTSAARASPRVPARRPHRALDPARVGDRGARGRSRRSPKGPAGSPVAPVPVATPASRAAGHRVEVERQLQLRHRATRRESDGRHPGRAVPTLAAARCRSSRPPGAPATLSAALSPDIAGSRSIRVRNSYSRKSRMTVSRS